MTGSRTPVHTGGCQCGAVRYALFAEPTNPHVCHCRMCQKAFGNAFAALAGVPLADFAWVRGEPGIFKSSEVVERGYCRDCGTPLFFRYVDKDRISVSLGSLDNPALVPPARRPASMAAKAAFPGPARCTCCPPAALRATCRQNGSPNTGVASTPTAPRRSRAKPAARKTGHARSRRYAGQPGPAMIDGR